MMAHTRTTTQTWSRTHARYVAGKVAADLRQLNQAYGSPAESRIDDFLDELTEYLAAGYLERVTYGFKKDGKWTLALRYTVSHDGDLKRDDRSGSIPRDVDLDGATWYSFLVQNNSWDRLSSTARQSFKDKLAIQRGSGTEPSADGTWRHDRTYSSAGGGVGRSVIGNGS